MVIVKTFWSVAAIPTIREEKPISAGWKNWRGHRAEAKKISQTLNSKQVEDKQEYEVAQTDERNLVKELSTSRYVLTKEAERLVDLR